MILSRYCRWIELDIMQILQWIHSTILLIYTHFSQVGNAWHRLTDDSNNVSWIAAGYPEGNTNDLVFKAEGSGGMPEFISNLPALKNIMVQVHYELYSIRFLLKIFSVQKALAAKLFPLALRQNFISKVFEGQWIICLPCQNASKRKRSPKIFWVIENVKNTFYKE